MLLENRELLHPLHVLLEHNHVVRVFLAGHVDAQIAADVRFVVADVAAERRFGRRQFQAGH